MTDDEIREVLRHIDINKDGSVDPTELDKWYTQLEQNNIAEKEAGYLRRFVEDADRSTASGLLVFLDFFGSGVFAMSGSLLAAETGMNAMGCILVGCVAGMGGGTISNLLHGQTPVFWIRDTRFLIVCVAASLSTFLVWQLLNAPETAPAIDSVIWRIGGSFDDVMFWCNTFGLAAGSIIGAQHGLRAGANPLVCCGGGVLIVLGGVIRDILCHRDIALAGADPYASSAFAGSTLYMLLRQSGLRLSVRVVVTGGAVVLTRVAYHFDWPWMVSFMRGIQALPAYQPSSRNDQH